MHRRHQSRLLFVALWLCLAAPAAFAQTAQITGRVSDQTGAVVPETKITVTNLGNGFKRETVTNSEGYYTVPLLQPGSYQIAAQKDGFKPVTQTGLTLQVEQAARYDFKLETGTVNETVNITGTSPLLESESSATGQVIDNQRVVELPLNGRNFVQLATLSPGTTIRGRNQFTGEPEVNINGNRV